MGILLAIIISLPFSAHAIDCGAVLQKLQQTVNDVSVNNNQQADNLENTGNYVAHLHSVLQTWEVRKILIPNGQFDFMKKDAQTIIESSKQAHTIAKDIDGQFESLMSDLSKCINN